MGHMFTHSLEGRHNDLKVIIIRLSSCNRIRQLIEDGECEIPNTILIRHQELNGLCEIRI